MKAFLTLSLLVFGSVSFASYTPVVEVSLGNDKSIHLLILNDSDMNLTCKYSVSWLVNTLTYRKEFGSVDLKASEAAEFAYTNDPSSHLSRINAKALCE